METCMPTYPSSKSSLNLKARKARIYSTKTSKSAKVAAKPRKLTFEDIPERVFDRILRIYCLGGVKESCSIRLVNKKLSILALPVLMHTIHVDSPSELARLARIHLSPLYHAPWISLVRCIQFSFTPDTFMLRASITSRQLILPNLETVRFKYVQGIPIRACDSDEFRQKMLSWDYLRRASNHRSNTSWFTFLSGLRPKRFEWISDAAHLRLVPVPPQYRKLFEIWAPETVLLDGVCPVEQSDLATWSPLFLAKRVHIRGRFHISQFYFLSGFFNLRPGCELLVLEKSPSTVTTGKPISTLIFGSMLIQVVNWTKLDRDALRLILTGKVPVRPLPYAPLETQVIKQQEDIEQQEVTKQQEVPPPSTKVRPVMHKTTFARRVMTFILLALFYIMGGALIKSVTVAGRATRRVRAKTS